MGSEEHSILDLFSIPKYRLQMLQTLRPEMTDIKEDDIRTISLNPVVLNGQYNDLAILVRDKLIIFVEAQSTWTINIIIRLLMYCAETYRQLINEQDMNVYGSYKLEIPEPEFYVIYTGSKKLEKDIITLREDFWHNLNAKMDLQVRVIHAESKDDVIGQYIIFCHVLDGQIGLYGRKKIAVENAIRICQDKEVLKEYLEGRKKEVIDIMRLLFDQNYAIKMYGREQKIEGVVQTCQKFGVPIDEAIRTITADFGLPEDVSTQYVHKFWRS